MNLEKHRPFLNSIKDYCANNPEISPYITDFIAQGINEALLKANERATDMEIALLSVIVKRFKNSDFLVLDKLKKWNGKTSLRWDDTIDKLETTQRKPD